ncbi:hypothetical protein [Nesterenkonia alkaliphila]|uniref:Uncharacterized protein n=1 Tax=Nesterenkonia alkaliphila TaxID=1463631 RepID=A0A7K1UK64_9MICC|nr:hypothetical protein [Nesterenkonia alkaliphila]MVT26401.1 hypothetical protein [Nesterenkonia alkaliphila]
MTQPNPIPDRVAPEWPDPRLRPKADNGGNRRARSLIAARDAAVASTGRRRIRRASSVSKLIPRPAHRALDCATRSVGRTHATPRASHRATSRAAAGFFPSSEGSRRRASSET